VLQVIRQEIPVPISVDTTRAVVAARAAVAAGADIVNDISAGTFDLDMLPTVAQRCSSCVNAYPRYTSDDAKLTLSRFN